MENTRRICVDDMIICKICNPNNPFANGYCGVHSTGSSTYLEIDSNSMKNNEKIIKKFEKMIKLFKKIICFLLEHKIDFKNHQEYFDWRFNQKKIKCLRCGKIL